MIVRDYSIVVASIVLGFLFYYGSKLRKSIKVDDTENIVFMLGMTILQIIIYHLSFNRDKEWRRDKLSFLASISQLEHSSKMNEKLIEIKEKFEKEMEQIRKENLECIQSSSKSKREMELIIKQVVKLIYTFLVYFY